MGFHDYWQIGCLSVAIVLQVFVLWVRLRLG